MHTNTSNAALRWFLINGGLLAALLWGIENQSGIGTLAVILLWCNMAVVGLSIIATASSDSIAAKMRRSVPLWLAMAYDIFVALFLAHRGWVWTSAVVIISAAIEASAFHLAKEMREKARRLKTEN